VDESFLLFREYHQSITKRSHGSGTVVKFDLQGKGRPSFALIDKQPYNELGLL